MKRLTLWKLATGMVTASLMVTSVASAVSLGGLPWDGPFCPHHPPRQELIVHGCETGVLNVAPGVTEFFLVMENLGEVSPPGCPQLEFSGVVSANIYRTGSRGRRTLAAALQGRIHMSHLEPGQSETFRIKWLRGRARAGDEGILSVAGLSCRIVVE